MDRQEGRSSTPAVAAAMALGTLGAAMLLMLPALLGSLARDYRFDATQLGLFSFADLGGLTMGSALGARLLPHAGVRIGSQCGLALAAIANIMSAIVSAFWPLLGLRVLAGLGAGIVVAAAYLVLARSQNVDRSFSAFLICQGIFSAIALQAVPYLTQLIGIKSVFAALAGLNIAALLLALAFPLSQLLAESGKRPRRFHSTLWVGLIAILMFFLAQGAVWAYLELIGMRDGIDPADISTGLALSTLVGLSGPLTAAFLGARLGRALPLCLGLVLGLIALGLLSARLDAASFATAACLFNVAWNFSIPYQLSALSTIDSSGVGVAWAASISLAGLAIGPLLASFVYRIEGYASVLGMSALLCILSVLGLMAVLMKRRAATS